MPIILYGYKIWSHTLWEEHSHKVSENKVLRRIVYNKPNYGKLQMRNAVIPGMCDRHSTACFRWLFFCSPASMTLWSRWMYVFENFQNENMELKAWVFLLLHDVWRKNSSRTRSHVVNWRDITCYEQNDMT